MCLAEIGQIHFMLEDGGLTCTKGVTGVEVQSKFMGNLRARIKMRFLPHDHLCAKKKGTRICTKHYLGGI